jgi:hypothetical protein
VELEQLSARILALPIDLAKAFLDDLGEAMEDRLQVMERGATRRTRAKTR